MKLTKKQIDIIIDNTPKELKGKQIGWDGDSFGSYQKAGANWSYHAVYITYNNTRILVVKCFGEIL